MRTDVIIFTLVNVNANGDTGDIAAIVEIGITWSIYCGYRRPILIEATNAYFDLSVALFTVAQVSWYAGCSGDFIEADGVWIFACSIVTLVYIIALIIVRTTRL